MDGVRRVSGLERLWLAAGRVAPPFALHFIVELTELPGEDSLQQAILALHSAWPTLHVRLQGSLSGCRWAPAAEAPPLRCFAGLPWGEGALAPALLEALDGGAGAPERGPTLWFSRCAGPRPLLVLSGLHSVLDGRSGYAILEALFGLLRGEAPGQPGPPLHEGARAKALGASLVAPPPADREAPFPPGGQPGAVGGNLVYHRLDVAPRRPLALALAAIARARPEAQLRVDLPVDLRAPELGLRLGNLTGLLRLELPEAEGHSLDSLAQIIQNSISDAILARDHLGGTLEAQRLVGLPLWLIAGVGRRRAAAERHAERVQVSMTASNLGRIDLGRLSAGPCRSVGAVTLPPFSPGLPALLTLTGCAAADGSCALSLVVAAPTSWIDADGLRRFMAGLAAALQGAAPTMGPA